MLIPKKLLLCYNKQLIRVDRRFRPGKKSGQADFQRPATGPGRTEAIFATNQPVLGSKLLFCNVLQSCSIFPLIIDPTQPAPMRMSGSDSGLFCRLFSLEVKNPFLQHCYWRSPFSFILSPFSMKKDPANSNVEGLRLR